MRRSPSLVTLSFRLGLALGVALGVVLAGAQSGRAQGARGAGTPIGAAAFTGRIMTVTGPIAPEALGVTLPHEHLFIDRQPPADTEAGWRAIGARQPASAEDRAFYAAPLTMDRIGAAFMGRLNADNRRLDDEARAIAEVTELQRAGGRTLVELTTRDVRRHPAALVRVSLATGVQIVMGTGWHARGYAGSGIEAQSVEQLTDTLVREITEGVLPSASSPSSPSLPSSSTRSRSGAEARAGARAAAPAGAASAGVSGGAVSVRAVPIRAGIIGEIGIENPRQPYDRKILAAAARASQRTGAPISLRMAPGSAEWLTTLAALKAEGADLARVAIGPADAIATNMALMRAILQQGAFLQFDRLGDAPLVDTEVSDHDVALAIVALATQSYGSQLLLSHDVSSKTDLKAFGGGGYAFLLEQFVPYLRRFGVTDERIRQLLVDNPARLLTFAAPRDAAPRATPQ